MIQRRNIELKARCADQKGARAAALAAGAVERGVLEQTDTYFHVPRGRLKLRETAGRGAELIFYQRADSAEFRDSQYILSPVPEPAMQLAALSAALGVRGVISKRRELLMYENVRIHLDDVERLGQFVEFEAVIEAAEQEAVSRQRLEMLARAMGIRDEDRLAVSNVDLAGF